MGIEGLAWQGACVCILSPLYGPLAPPFPSTAFLCISYTHTLSCMLTASAPQNFGLLWLRLAWYWLQLIPSVTSTTNRHLHLDMATPLSFDYRERNRGEKSEKKGRKRDCCIEQDMSPLQLQEAVMRGRSHTQRGRLSTAVLLKIPVRCEKRSLCQNVNQCTASFINKDLLRKNKQKVAWNKQECLVTQLIYTLAQAPPLAQDWLVTKSSKTSSQSKDQPLRNNALRRRVDKTGL